MQKPDVKQLIMPAFITFILIIASFTIASKYELKSLMKKPVKINSPIFRPADTIEGDQGELEPRLKQESDTTLHSVNEQNLTPIRSSMSWLPHEINLIFLHKYQLRLSFPLGT